VAARSRMSETPNVTFTPGCALFIVAAQIPLVALASTAPVTVEPPPIVHIAPLRLVDVSSANHSRTPSAIGSLKGCQMDELA
jgi:hypothetical protein